MNHINATEIAEKLNDMVVLIDAPEEARALNEESYGSLRSVIDEVVQSLWCAEGDEEFKVERPAYKLSMLAELMDAGKSAADFSHDAWSGIRIMLEEVIADLQHAGLQTI